ncbi:MAG: AroM family protein [Firmicutes bacterium]|nr:AroM family protein [Bacillota bacterium]
MPFRNPVPGEDRPRRIGLVTIGQSPRSDVVPRMLPHLGAVEVIEAGALDGLGPQDLALLEPQDPHRVLVTRLRDGSSVRVDKDLVLSRMKDSVARLEKEGVSLIVLLCTGTFPRMGSGALVLEPDRILRHVVLGVHRDGLLGVMVPLEEQIDTVRNRWQELGIDVAVAAGSPYGSTGERLRAAQALRAAGATLVVLDCMGYTAAMKEEIRPIAGCPVIVAHEAVARVAGALL